MWKQILVLQVLLMLVIYSDADRCSTGYLYNRYSKTCMRMVKIKKNWQDAKNYCQSAGEYLATFQKFPAGSWFVNMRQTYNDWKGFDAWIGGYIDTNTGLWSWSGLSTRALTYSMWAEGQPSGGSEYCMESDFGYTGTHKFNDARCFLTNYFVCEKRI